MRAAFYDWTLWADEVMRGRIVIPNPIMGKEGFRLVQAILTLRRRHQVGELGLQRIMLYVDCDSGDATCWKAAYHLDRLRQDAGLTIDSEIHCAISAGLIVAMIGEHRTCHPHSKFLWHGSRAKTGYDESGKSDEDRARFMADRTQRPFEWWMEKAEDGDSYQFGAVEAMEIGVVQEINEDVLL